MLRTSQRTSDSDEYMVYETANRVRVRKDPPSEPIKMEKAEMSDPDEELPYDMEQIKTSGSADEPVVSGSILCGPGWSRKTS